MQLSFRHRALARLCNQEMELLAWAGEGASPLQQLLNELACGQTLGLVEFLPHLALHRGRAGRVAASGAERAFVLLGPEDGAGGLNDAAEAALVLAVAVGDEQVNPEGELWPKACAFNLTTP